MTAGMVHAALDAAILHGAGEEALLEFRNSAALDALARLVRLQVPTDACSPTLVDQLHEITAWLVSRPVHELRGICEQPAFRVWLGDAERALRAGSPRADRLLAHLPYIFLNRLAALQRKVWSAAIAGTVRAAPLGLPFRYHAAQPDTPVTISTESGEPHLSGEHITRVERSFALLDIEIFTTADFPELARENSESGEELTPSAAEPRQCLADAFHFLVEAWPEAIPDLMAVFRGVVALDAPGGHTYSASAPTAPLIVQLTLRPKEFSVVLAETIVHETAHLKLHTLNEMEPLLVDDGALRHHHPWRPDLRPLQGVLLGAHAFLNVTRMYEKAIANGSRDPFVSREREVRLAEVKEALGTLARHGQFTPAGRAVFEGMCCAAGYQP